MRFSVFPVTCFSRSSLRLRDWDRLMALWPLWLERCVSLPVPVILKVFAARLFVLILFFAIISCFRDKMAQP
jgi:hypothetical protein